MTYRRMAGVDQAIREKRSSQFGKLHQGLHPAGYTPESFAGRTAHKFDDGRLQQVATFVEQMRQAYDVPGVAIGIVQDGNQSGQIGEEAVGGHHSEHAALPADLLRCPQ